MAKISKRNNQKPHPLAGEEKQLPLPLDLNPPAENQTSDQDTTALIAEVEHTCPVCGIELQRKKGCWSCDGCGYLSCGDGA